LVFPSDLKKIKEVGGRCVNSDEIFVRRGEGVREGRDGELLRSLE
jgi:hypothetical protein